MSHPLGVRRNGGTNRPAQALELRLLGLLTYDEIARRLDYAGRSCARAGALSACRGDRRLIAACAAVRAGTHRANGRWNHGNGYIRVRAPGHPLAAVNGVAMEHRIVLYEAIGPGPHPCHWCGDPLDWTWASLVVDHLNGIHDDNRPDNLVPSCIGCNVTREQPAPPEPLCGCAPPVSVVDGICERCWGVVREAA